MSRTTKRARRKGGFTLIEVMVAMGIMVLGLTMVITLQAETVAANGFARQMSIASSIATIWGERMKQDGHRWTEIGVVGGMPTPVVALSQTQWLQAVNVTPNVYQTMPATAFTSGAFDYQGNELVLGAAGGAPFYCVGYRPSWVWVGGAVRVDIRVFWPRERASAVVTCVDNDAALNPGGPLFNRFHFVYNSVVVKQTPITR